MVGLVVTMGCGQEDQVSPSEETVEVISLAELPSSAQVYLSSNYSENEIAAVYRVSNDAIVKYEAETTSGVNLRFAADGSFSGKGAMRKGHKGRHGDKQAGEEITLEETPEALRSYLAANYADAEIKRVLLITLSDTTKRYAVHLAEVGVAIFDEAGEFLNLKERGPHGDRPELTEIEISALPAGVTNYIAANYEGAVIEKSGLATLSDSTTNFVVKLEDGPVLVFSSEGAFIREHTPGGHHGGRPAITELEASELPEAILTYLTANYPDVVVERAGTVTLPDGSIRYLIRLSTGEHLHFDEEGNLLD